MSNTNNVTYQIALTPENAPKIDAINQIMLGDSYTTEAPKKVPATGQKKTAPAEKKPTTKKETSEKSAPTITMAEVKAAAKAAKKDHGEDFVKGVLEANDVEVATTLGRAMSAIPENAYAAIIALWEAGPPVTEQASDEPEDDGLGDDDEFGDDDASEVTAEAVKKAVKAYAKSVDRDEAKAILADNGAASLSKVDDCSQEQLQAIFKAVV